ncbi:hypothetical protein JVT61DRAFT_11243 [Boletus reticuloceps]|uniref:Ubiquitin-like protease family profile domain-containing protein n=1 Tax=Boletus reticuloceps TaxID=495285 RepID=A0A8I2YEX6_9AGAM|nr:hypothetical protein JVT61DRAFT_11243 [Boletus reticuloceps]
MADRLKDWTPVQELRQFASHDWLSGSNLNVMLNVMYEQIKVVNPAVELEYKIQSTYFYVLLRAARKSHLQGHEYYSGASSLQSVGTLLANQPHKICFLSHIQGNHWTGIAIDAVQLHISYGNSMQQAVPDDLKDAIKWWLALYFTSPFTWEPLAITAQIDSYSCGLLAANSLMHYINPNIHPLLLPHPADLDVAHLHWGNMVISSHQTKEGNKCTPTTNKSTTELTPSLAGRKPGGEMISPRISSRSSSLHHKPSNKQPGVSEPPKKQQKTLDTPTVREEETFDGELVNVCRAEKKSARGKTQGRPRTSLLDKVTQQCHPPGDPKKL